MESVLAKEIRDVANMNPNAFADYVGSYTTIVTTGMEGDGKGGLSANARRQVHRHAGSDLMPLNFGIDEDYLMEEMCCDDEVCNCNKHDVSLL
jgi:hypothetical protein